MKKHQIILIVCLVLAPVITGIFFLKITSSKSSSNFPLSSQAKKIGLVRIFDIIYFSENYVEQLQELRKDNSIAGVILRINSPGGGVAPSQEIYEEVMNFRDDNKPLVVSMGNVAASGGYYIASPATKIFANPGTITGSIGVIFKLPHYYNLLEKIGVKMTTIKAGEYKDIGNPNRDLTEKETVFLQALLDNTHKQFIEDVSLARYMEKDSLRKLADGRIFTGQQALGVGLVDSLGGYSAALSYLKTSLNLPEKTKVIEKKKQPSIIKELLSSELSKHFSFVKNVNLPAGCYFLLQNF
jgi:protease-4